MPALTADAGFGAAQAAGPPSGPQLRTSGAGFSAPQSARAAASPASHVASAGFAAPTVSQTSTPAATPAVKPGAFLTASAQTAAARPKLEQAPPSDVEILYKPKPVYTEEARRLKIEGEVLLEVIFTGAGEVKVLCVAKGLGHGLDEAAVQAATRMRFKPAERDGRKVDSPATARITFSLAY
jgi:TonB family protein